MPLIVSNDDDPNGRWRPAKQNVVRKTPQVDSAQALRGGMRLSRIFSETFNEVKQFLPKLIGQIGGNRFVIPQD